MAKVGIEQKITGSIGQVHDLRHVGNDKKAVVDFSIAVTPRFNDNGTWKDGKTIWRNCTAWGRLAENIHESLRPGDRVVVYGYTQTKDGYTNKEGVEVPDREQVVATEVGLELAFDSARSNRVAKTSSNRSNGNSGNAGNSRSSKPAPKPVETDDFDLDLDFDSEDEIPF